MNSSTQSDDNAGQPDESTQGAPVGTSEQQTSPAQAAPATESETPATQQAPATSPEPQTPAACAGEVCCSEVPTGAP
ncbi:MAG: hypothetical protein L0H60_13265, partial [Micrococcaceae bacterium]|nr:hypothetical protein [Micrococcaceae bacterium]